MEALKAGEYHPKISILMGIYNCEDTLEEAVNSIIDQTEKNWELILCDDGSSDETYALACRLQNKDSRIVVIRNSENQGLAYTLNHCLQVARGSYIARMDGDDRCSADRFEKELCFLEHNPDFAVVSCAMDFFDAYGTYGVSIYNEYPQRKDLIKGSPFCHAGCMMRKNVLLDLSGYNTSPSVERMEDYDLWFRLYSAGYCGYNLNEILYSMRDDRNAFKRRKFKYRVNSSKLKLQIYRKFRPGITKIPYIFMPVIKGLMPEKLYMFLHRKKLARNFKEGAL